MKKGFTLIELLVVILISVLIIGAVTGLYIAHQKIQAPTKAMSDIVEIQRAGMAQLEWLFSRWGTGTPCNNLANICTKIISCDINGTFVYPPPSSLCVTIVKRDPCDELYFYANLEGLAIVNDVSVNKARLLSCRLKEKDEEGNKYCFYIMRHGRFFRDASNNSQVLIFGLENLNPQNVDCIDYQYTNPATYNAECSRNATIYNGAILQGGIPQNWLLLEGGDIVMHIPKLIKLYCERDEKGILWIEMKKLMPGIDVPGINPIPENCTKDLNIIQKEPPIRISPVESFKVSSESNGIRVEIVFRNFENPTSPNYQTMRVVRYFGR